MAMTHDPTNVSVSDPVDPVGVDGGAAAPADADGPVGPEPASEAAPALTWAESEVLDALRRLARAQAQLAAAEAQVAVADSTSFDPADVARLEQVHAELESARSKASGRAKKSARQRVRDLETTERLVLERLGVGSYEDYRVQADRSRGSQVVDSEVIDFARRELRSAQQAWHEVQALDAAAVEPDPPAEPEIDLT